MEFTISYYDLHQLGLLKTALLKYSNYTDEDFSDSRNIITGDHWFADKFVKLLVADYILDEVPTLPYKAMIESELKTNHFMRLTYDQAVEIGLTIKIKPNVSGWPVIKSESGDMYAIPPDRYESDKKHYYTAVSQGEINFMMFFEEGCTGWKLIDE